MHSLESILPSRGSSLSSRTHGTSISAPHHRASTIAPTSSWSPGRTFAVSPEEAPDPPNTVVPSMPATSSRPGPVVRAGNGVFRAPNTGKYAQSTNPSLPDSLPISRASSTTRHMQSDISIYYQNVGGLNGLVDDYRLAALDHSYDIIVLTETWLDSRTVSSYVFGNGYEVFRCDRNSNNSRKSTGGGVIVAVDSRLKAKLIDDISWNIVEQVWIAVQLGDRQLFLCAVYIPPDRTRDLDLIDAHCRSISSVSDMAGPSDEVIILGDFNLAGIAWTPIHSGFLRPDLDRSSFHSGATKLLDNYSIATLSQINGEKNENNRFLDLCFVSGRATAPFISVAPAPLVKDVPHHRPLLVSIEDNVVRDLFTTPAAVSYNFHKADYRSIAEVLSSLDWENILNSDDVNSAAETFAHVLMYVIDRHVPKKTVQINHRIPWMSKDLRSLKRSKKAALRRYTKYRTLPLKFHYVRLNHEYKRLSRFCFNRYQRGIQRRLRSHPKTFWNYVNEQRKEVGLPSSMVFNGVTASTQQEICNLFSAKFANVFQDEQLSADHIAIAVNNVPLANQSLGNIEVNVESISKAMSKLKSSSKPGPDGVPSVFLKKNIAYLLDPLILLFRRSLSSKIFPSCWQTADMFPVYKKGSKRDVDNYRGITSLSAVSKLFELIVMDPVYAHCKQYLCADQHGFLPYRSTTTNLLCLTSYITDSMIARAQTDVVYTDLTAAFDKLNHEIAIAKLERLGVCGSLLGWFRSYLTGRKLAVTLGDCRSASFQASSGIPQGSHLGPLIFLLYFKDVHYVIRGPRLSFADDLKIFLRIRSISDCRSL